MKNPRWTRVPSCQFRCLHYQQLEGKFLILWTINKKIFNHIYTEYLYRILKYISLYKFMLNKLYNNYNNNRRSIKISLGKTFNGVFRGKLARVPYWRSTDVHLLNYRQFTHTKYNIYNIIIFINCYKITR